MLAGEVHALAVGKAGRRHGPLLLPRGQARSSASARRLSGKRPSAFALGTGLTALELFLCPCLRSREPNLLSLI